MCIGLLPPGANPIAVKILIIKNNNKYIVHISKFILKVLIFTIIIIIIIIKFLTSQLWLGNIHLSWDVVINRIKLGGLICSLKSFLQLNMCQEL